MQLVSPQAMMDAAIQQMLGGCTPQSTMEWSKVINFVAFNVEHRYAHAVSHIFCAMFDCPLTYGQVEEIVDFQLRKRAQLN